MKTTLTFVIDTATDEDGDYNEERTDLEKHHRGPEIADALAKMYRAVLVKVHGAKGVITPDHEPAEPPESWQEVLDLLDDHTKGVEDLL